MFTHDDIHKSKSAIKVINFCSFIALILAIFDNKLSIDPIQAGHGCNWLLRSPETEEFDVLNVVGDWQVWVGVIGKTEVSITTNACTDISDCNLNGECINGLCVCTHEPGVSFMYSYLQASCSFYIFRT